MELLKNLKVLDKRTEFKVNKAPQSDPLHSSLVLLADKSYGPAEGQKKKKKKLIFNRLSPSRFHPTYSSCQGTWQTTNTVYGAVA